jgi:hypothetical protein
MSVKTSDKSTLVSTGAIEGEIVDHRNMPTVPGTRPVIVAHAEGGGDDRVYVNHQTVVNIYTNNKSILDYLMSFLGRGSN